jgi:hypothetical protein
MCKWGWGYLRLKEKKKTQEQTAVAKKRAGYRRSRRHSSGEARKGDGSIVFR